MRMRILFISAILFVTLLSFEDQTRCYKQLQQSFFRDDFTLQALSLFDVPQSQWVIILADLKVRVLSVPDRLKRRTMHMRPDPLHYPFNPEIAREVLYQTLFDIFIETMHANSISSEADIHDMFNYIFSRQRVRWEECLGRERS